MSDLLQTYKYPFLVALVGFIFIISGTTFSLLPDSTNSAKPSIPPESLTDKSTLLIKVDIAGAVNKPGVYELHKDTRLEELLIKAGGFTTNAHKEYISKSLNLSQKVTDSQKIYIPFQSENLNTGVVSGVTTSNPEIGAKTDATSKISINTATQPQLEELPGVGPSTASKIIAGRPYGSTNELLTKKSVGKATYEKIKDRLEI